MSERIAIVTGSGPAYSICRCGVRGDVCKIETLSSVEPTYVAGMLHEPCRCPRCVSCQHLLDDDGRCENLDCLNLGLKIVVVRYDPPHIHNTTPPTTAEL